MGAAGGGWGKAAAGEVRSCSEATVPATSYVRRLLLARAQFRYVARLVLIHGRAFYRRNSEVVLYSFYKNWAFNLTYVYFAFVTGEPSNLGLLCLCHG